MNGGFYAFSTVRTYESAEKYFLGQTSKEIIRNQTDFLKIKKFFNLIGTGTCIKCDILDNENELDKQVALVIVRIITK